MNNLRDDFRYSLRALMARPMLVAIAVLTLALGIGANTAIFSLVHGMLAKPLPFPESDRMVWVYNDYERMGFAGGSSVPDYLDRREARSLDAIALVTTVGLSLSDGDTPQRISAARATPDLFDVLRVQPALGRAFGNAEAEPGADRVIVLSHHLWQRRFGGREDVVGSDLRVDGETYRVLGVMPPGITFPYDDTDAIVPFAIMPGQRTEGERGNEFSRTIARLAPGATVQSLERELAAIADATMAVQPDFRTYATQTGYVGRATTLRDEQIGGSRDTLLMLQAVALLVLCVAAANVGNLMLARMTSRRRELSVRVAMGAGRGRIAAQLLVESLLLGVTGGILGVAFAFVLVAVLEGSGLTPSGTLFDVSPDPWVIAFGFGLSVATGLLFGLIPALAWSDRRLHESLKDSARDASGGRRSGRLRTVLAAVQLGLAVVLLTVSGLLVRSFGELLDRATGFEAGGVLSARVDLPTSRYGDDAALVAVQQRMLDAAATLPGVREVGIVNNLPFGGSDWSMSFALAAHPVAEGDSNPNARQLSVNGGYFDALGIPLLAGRTFDERDRAGAAGAVVVDQRFVDLHFAEGEDPIGQRIAPGDTPRDPSGWWTIVGVVGSVRQQSLESDDDIGTMYRSFRQMPVPVTSLVVATDVAPEGLVAPLREAVRGVDADQALYDVRTLDDRIRASLSARRTPLTLALAFGGIALVLSAIGIYAVLSYAVAQRRGEIGVRMALGADRARVVGLVLRDGVRLAAVGLALGIAGALVAARLIASQLYGVSSFDPLAFLGALALLGAVTAIACLLPARRAASVSPVVALRHE